MSHKYVELNEGNFDEIVLKSSKPVLVDFWAGWCGPCKMFAPTIEEVAEDFDGKAVVGKLDIDAAPSIAERYGVMSIPTVVVFNHGNEAARSVGVIPKGKVEKLLNDNL